MDESFEAQLAALGNEVRTAAIPPNCQHSAVWCIDQLPTLYAQFKQSSESRYCDEINRLVRGALAELVKSQTACPEAGKLAVSISTQLQLLHEQLGLPGLNLKLAGTPPSRSRKAG